MIKVYVKKQSNYAVSTPRLKKELEDFFKSHGIVSNAEVSVAIVGEAKMKSLARKYLNERNSVHNVLSFTESETKEPFIGPKNAPLQLGEIVLCYPKILAESNAEGVRIDEKAVELAKHAALHLLGVHHD